MFFPMTSLCQVTFLTAVQKHHFRKQIASFSKLFMNALRCSLTIDIIRRTQWPNQVSCPIVSVVTFVQVSRPLVVDVIPSYHFLVIRLSYKTTKLYLLRSLYISISLSQSLSLYLSLSACLPLVGWLRLFICLSICLPLSLYIHLFSFASHSSYFEKL